MSTRKKRRLISWCQNLLILLLLCSAILLGGQVLTGSAGGLWGSLSSYFTQDGGEDGGGSGGSQAELLTATVRPMRLAITQADTYAVRRYAVQYGDLSALYESVSPILAEAVTAAQPPRRTTEEAWRQALQSTGIYYDYLGAVPLSTLSLWLTGEGEDFLTGSGSVRRLCLAAGQDGATALYYFNESDRLYYTCPIALDLSAQLDAALSGYSSNRAQFAFELGAAYEALDPYTLILDHPPTPGGYTASSPFPALVDLELDRLRQDVLQALSFHPQTNSIYAITGGAAVREGADTLRLYTDGRVEYRAGDLAEPRFPAGTDPVETARALAEDTIGALCGGARLYLSQVTTNQAGRRIITFDYALDGAAVQLSTNSHAARFLVENGVIAEFTLTFRAYTATGETTLLLPELQAAAAATALDGADGELLLRYEDTGGQGDIRAIWTIQ